MEVKLGWWKWIMHAGWRQQTIWNTKEEYAADEQQEIAKELRYEISNSCEDNSQQLMFYVITKCHTKCTLQQRTENLQMTILMPQS